MNDFEENRFTMQSAVLSLLKKHQNKINEIEKFATQLKEFEETLNAIPVKDQTYQQANLTADKNKIEDQLIENFLICSAALNVYADFNDEDKLKQETELTESKLEKMRDTELIVKSEDIINKTDKYIDELADYGFDDQALAQLQTLTSEFKDLTNDNETLRAKKVTARKELTELFSEAGKQLRKLDKFVTITRTKIPELYKEYQQTRSIKDV
jgi:hypothetical protein